MFEWLEARLAVAAARLKDRAAERVAETLANEFAGIDVSHEPDRVVLAARGLRRRLFEDARLRWIGALFR